MLLLAAAVPEPSGLCARERAKTRPPRISAEMKSSLARRSRTCVMVVVGGYTYYFFYA